VADGLRLLVVTPLRTVLDTQTEEVQLPGILGALGVLPGHTPLLTALGTGELAFRGRADSGLLVVSGGFAEVLPDQVTVLADLVEAPEEIDLAAARAEQRSVEAAMTTASAGELDDLVARARLASARISVGERRR
jgi:F-type H+-transporting ATPase subunit epsilon